MDTLTIVVPVYKDGNLAQSFCQKLSELLEQKFFQSRDVGKVSLLFISDGIEADQPLLKACCDQYDFARMISFSRNFGQHIALSAGISNASSSLVAFTDIDMEDPLEALVDLIKELRNKNAEVAVGLRVDRQVSFSKKLSSRLFHTFLGKLTGLDIPQNATTMRVMTRRYIKAFNCMPERSRYIPGMEAWLGFKTVYFPIEQRESGKTQSSYSFMKKLKMAVTAVISFSDMPLRWAAYSGFLVTLLSFLAGLTIFCLQLIYGGYQAGYATYTILISFFGGFQIFVTGVAGLYVGRILKEVQARPLYVIKEAYPNSKGEANGAG